MTVVHTGVQSSLSGDKRCGVYVMSGMRATTEEVLTRGTDDLKDDAKVRDIIQREHHHVKHGHYLQDNCDRENFVKKTPDGKTASDLLSNAIDEMARDKSDGFVNAVDSALTNYSDKHS